MTRISRPYKAWPARRRLDSETPAKFSTKPRSIDASYLRNQYRNASRSRAGRLNSAGAHRHAPCYFFHVAAICARKGGGTSVSKPCQSGLIIEKEVDRLLLDGFVPASIVVNEALDIVQFRRRTGGIWNPPRESLPSAFRKWFGRVCLIDLRNALIQAKRKRQIIRKQGVRIKSVSPWRKPPKSKSRALLFPSAL